MKQREFKMTIKCWQYLQETLTVHVFFFFLQYNKLNIQVLICE